MNYFSKACLFLILCLAACQNEPEPYPGKAPKRAVLGAPPPTVNPELWIRDVKNWGTEAYFYHSPHFQGNLLRKQAGLNTNYPGDHLKQIAFLATIDPLFNPYLDAAESAYQEKLASEVYEACITQELDFYYSIPFPIFPVHDLNIIQGVHPELFGEDSSLNLTHPLLLQNLEEALKALQKAMPDIRGISLTLEEGNGHIYNLSPSDLENIEDWLPSLLQTLDKTTKALGIKGLVSIQSIHHTNKSRHLAYEIFNQFPDLVLLENATWPEENTRMSFLGFIPPADTQLIKRHEIATKVLTDTEYLGKGKIPVVLPAWWQYLAQQAHLREVDMTIARSFQGDEGSTATNFNRINLHLLLHFLRNPRADLKTSLHAANEEMFGDDFPSRLTSIMIIAEDAIQAITTINYLNPLNDSHFPRPQFLDHDYLTPPYTLKAIDDLFEPPGTPLYPEETEQPDTLSAPIHWRWQGEVSAQPVDEYLLNIDNAINWLDKIQKEVDYLTLDFPPEQRQLFIGGYRDLLLMGRAMYQFIQGAAVHHRWHRLQKMTKVEALAQLAPIAQQIRLIADEADDSSLHLKQDFLQMAEAFETLDIERIEE